MTGHYIAEQVAAFFAERGLLPVVTVGGAAKVHAAYPQGGRPGRSTPHTQNAPAIAGDTAAEASP